MTNFDEDSLRRSLKLRVDMENRKELIPERLMVWALAQKYKMTEREIEERLKQAGKRDN